MFQTRGPFGEGNHRGSIAERYFARASTDPATSASFVTPFGSGSAVTSRSTIAAGMLPNNAGTRAAWISNPQSLKPGVNMPPLTLSPADLAALNAFLGGLE